MYLKSAPRELSSNGSHDEKCWLQQKLGIVIFWKKTSEMAISQERKMKKAGKKVFLNVYLTRNLLVYVEKLKSKEEFLVIFMRKWVYILFGKKGKYDKILHMKNGRFFTLKIYIWNLPVKSFPTIGSIMAKADYNLKLVILIFWKKLLKGQYLNKRKWKKLEKMLLLI